MTNAKVCDNCGRRCKSFPIEIRHVRPGLIATIALFFGIKTTADLCCWGCVFGYAKTQADGASKVWV